MTKPSRKNMKLTFLGTGSAFTTRCNNYNSNMLLTNTDTGRILCIDCGSDARHALAELGLSHRDIESVYISHLHADHVGGVEWLALSTQLDPNCKKPVLYAHPEVLKYMWEHTLRGGLSTLEGKKANLKTYFNPKVPNRDGIFVWENIDFQTVQTLHIIDNYRFMPSFGLMFTIHGTRTFITTDTQLCPHQIINYYQEAHIIFQDCEILETPSMVHANYRELCALAPEIKAKMWLYHYNPGPLPDAVGDGFCGFVQKGQTFSF